MSEKFSLAAAMQKALLLIAQAVERCHSLLLTVNKDTPMWSSNILDYPAHWLLIAHNARNNTRTKAKRKK